MIPKVLHNIWLGPNPFPSEYEQYLKIFQELHPDWEIFRWRESNVESKYHPAISEKLRLPAERADILRLYLLREFGGLYLDADIEVLRNLDELFLNEDFVICELKPNGRVNNAFMASSKNHEILDFAIANLKPVVWPGLDKAGTGPLLIEQSCKKSPHKRLEWFTFYPRNKQEELKAYAIHHSRQSWKSQEELVKEINSLRKEIFDLKYYKNYRFKFISKSYFFLPKSLRKQFLKLTKKK